MWSVLSGWGFRFFYPCAAGWPKLLWFVTESKHLSKPPRDWFPHIKDANNDTAYIEVTQTHTHVVVGYERLCLFI